MAFQTFQSFHSISLNQKASFVPNIAVNNQSTTNLVLPIFYAILGSLFISLCAQIRIPLPFTPIPITLQTLAVMLIGGSLGPKTGVLSVCFYLAQILLGLPVQPSSLNDPLVLIGPKAGYYFGFIPQAAIIGLTLRKFSSFQPFRIFSAALLSCALQLCMGTLWLGVFLGFNNMWLMGFFPFIIGESIKSLVIMAYFTKRTQTLSKAYFRI